MIFVKLILSKHLSKHLRFICKIDFIKHLKKGVKRSRAALYSKSANLRGPHNFRTRAAVCTPTWFKPKISNFFHNGPNYKFKHNQRAAKLHILYMKFPLFNIKWHERMTSIKYILIIH